MSCKGQRGAWGSPSVVIQGVGGVGVGGKPMPVLCPRCPGMGSCLSGVNESSSYPTTHMPYVRGPGMAHTRVHRISTPNSPPSPHLGRCPRETPTTVLPSSSCSPHGITPQGLPSVTPPLFPPHSRTHRACAYTHHVLCRLYVCSVCSGDAASGTSPRTAYFPCCGRGFPQVTPRTFRGNSA